MFFWWVQTCFPFYFVLWGTVYYQMGGSLGKKMFWKVYAWDLRLHPPTNHAPCPEAKEECGVRAIRRARELGRFRVDTGKGPKISVWHKPKQQRNVFSETVGHLLVYIFWYTGSAQKLSTSKEPTWATTRCWKKTRYAQLHRRTGQEWAPWSCLVCSCGRWSAGAELAELLVELGNLEEWDHPLVIKHGWHILHFVR